MVESIGAHRSRAAVNRESGGGKGAVHRHAWIFHICSVHNCVGVRVDISVGVNVMHRHDVVGHHVVFPCTGNVVTGGAGTGACVEEYGGGMSGHNDDYEGEECFIYDRQIFQLNFPSISRCI